MSQVFTQQQGNRTERRRLQREESKKWRKDEKKLMRNGPNGSRYNSKKSRRVTQSGATDPMNNSKPIKHQGPPVSIKNRDFIIIDKVFDVLPVSEPFSPIDFLETDANESIVPDIFGSSNPEESTVPEVKLQEKQDKSSASITNVSNEEIEKENVENGTFVNQIHNSDTKNVTVSEVPAFNKNIDDETPTVKSDTLQEEDLQNESVQEHNDSHVTVDTISTIEQEEEQIETSLTLEDKDVVPTPSLSDKSIPANNNDESALLNSDKNSQWNTKDNSATIVYTADKNSPSATTSSTTASSTIATKKQSRKRSIISRIFKNNRIEIKQKPQEKNIATIKEHPEKKKASAWKKIWKKL